VKRVGKYKPVLVALLALSLPIFFAGHCSAAEEEYFYLPVFHTSVEDAVGTIRNMQMQFVGWHGLYLKKIEVDRYGLRTFGTADFSNPTNQWVYTGIGPAGGISLPGQQPVHQEETTIVPFDSVVQLRLMHYPDLNRDFKWGVVCLLKDAKEFPAFRTPTRELAAKLYNAIASLCCAAGYPPVISRIGIFARDITPADLKSKTMKSLGLTEAKGVLVTSVAEESPAKVGGLLAGEVIVACNDQSIGTIADWGKAVPSEMTSIVLRVLKKGGPINRCIELIQSEKLPQFPPTLSFGAASTQSPAKTEQKPPKLGFSLRILTDQERQMLGGKPGVVVSVVTVGGLAEAAGLQVGDILFECNGKPILSPSSLGNLLVQGENAFSLERKGDTMILKISPDASY